MSHGWQIGILVFLAGYLLPVFAVAAGEDRHGHDHDATVRHGFEDVARWVAIFDDPARDAWQKPEDVIRFLKVAPGQVVADLGAGTGYFTVRLARAVGANGKVFGVDVEPAMVDYLGERAAKAGLTQVIPVLAAANDPKLPESGVSLVLICDTWHHIDDRLNYLARLSRALRPGGTVAVVDWREGKLPVGPPPKAKLSRAAVIDEFRHGGFRLVDKSNKLPYQYMLDFAPVGEKGR